MLSGVGPAEHLNKHGIAVIKDMPGVGSNLHDHFNTYVAYKCAQPVTMNDLVNSLPRRILAGMQYAFGRTGPLASMGLYVGALVRSDRRLERPDLQINMFAWAIKERNRHGVVAQPFSAFGLSPVHLRPDGRGTVRLKSADPLAAPEIRFNFLKSANDWNAMIEGLRICREIGKQPALKPFVVEEILPGADVTDEAGLRADIRANGVSNLHPVGTCRMGRDVDDVVDPQLRVHGIERLRVADASIMPQHRRRQHQRALDHDRREMRRHGPSGGAVIAGGAPLQQTPTPPHPEEHRVAVRLEGWEPVVLLPTLRDAPCGRSQGEVIGVSLGYHARQSTTGETRR